MQTCPICHKSVGSSERYPRYVCRDCAAQATSHDERLLKFYNDSLSGGISVQYADTGELYNSHDCYIRGVRCHADEHHLGGTVIQKAY
jgi:hypothetical protein